MKEATKQREKKCPVCAKEYPEEDNYCRDDGSVLKPVPTTKNLSEQRVSADELNAEFNSVLQR
jgi:hypothetical protein